MKTIVENVHLIPMGYSNAYLVEAKDELVLIDAGFPGEEKEVFDAITKLGRPMSDLRHIIFTHGHPDHIGSAAAIVRATGALTYMHHADAPLAEQGGGFRTMHTAHGLLQRLMFNFFWHQEERTAPFIINHWLRDNEYIDIAGGFQVTHVPGHSAGHVVLRWNNGQMLFAGDVGTNLFAVGDPVGFEDEKLGKESQRRVAELAFTAVCFGHGSAITENATSRLRAAWSSDKAKKTETWRAIATAILTTMVMSAFFSGFFSLLAMGPSQAWLLAWAKGFALGWPSATILAFIVGPWAQRLARRLITA